KVEDHLSNMVESMNNLLTIQEKQAGLSKGIAEKHKDTTKLTAAALTEADKLMAKAEAAAKAHAEGGKPSPDPYERLMRESQMLKGVKYQVKDETLERAEVRQVLAGEKGEEARTKLLGEIRERVAATYEAPKTDDPHFRLRDVINSAVKGDFGALLRESFQRIPGTDRLQYGAQTLSMNLAAGRLGQMPGGQAIAGAIPALTNIAASPAGILGLLNMMNWPGQLGSALNRVFGPVISPFNQARQVGQMTGDSMWEGFNARFEAASP